MPKETATGSIVGREGECACLGRHAIVKGLALAGCAAATEILTGSAAFAEAARSQRPEPGDRLTFMSGDNEGKIVAPADVKLGEAPLLAYPMDPKTQTVIQSRASLILLVRLKEDEIGPSTKPHSADGIVAYSAVCTHNGCPITGIHDNKRMIVCNCHGSTFDVGNDGAVAHGPATRRLAMLPITITDGALVVAGKLDGPIGPPAV